MNAIDTLKQIMSRYYWHGGKIPPKKAGSYKQQLTKGMMSYELACKILNEIGWVKVQEEVWQPEAHTAAKCE